MSRGLAPTRCREHPWVSQQENLRVLLHIPLMHIPPLCRGTVHEDQTDFAFLPGKLFSLIFGRRGTLDPHKTLAITSRAALAFLQRHLSMAQPGGAGWGLGGHQSLLSGGDVGQALPPRAWGWCFPTEGSGGCPSVAPVTWRGDEVTLSPSVPRAELEEEFGQWDELLEGVGDSVVRDSPFSRSHL